MYKVQEIVTSFSGECSSFPQGAITTIVRFSGCNLSCPSCDNPNHMKGEEYTLEQLIKKLPKKPSNILLTGGEPLLQVDEKLVACLALLGHKICIETNGTILPRFSHDLSINLNLVVDLKPAPCYGDSFYFLEQEWLSLLGSKDVLKVIVRKEADLDEGIKIINRMYPDLYNKNNPTFAFSLLDSPATSLSKKDLLEQLIKVSEQGRSVCLNLQTHKFIGAA